MHIVERRALSCRLNQDCREKSGVCGFASEFDQYAVRANINLARYEPAPP
jgi:hypothetical protein